MRSLHFYKWMTIKSIPFALVVYVFSTDECFCSLSLYIEMYCRLMTTALTWSVGEGDEQSMFCQPPSEAAGSSPLTG